MQPPIPPRRNLLAHLFLSSEEKRPRAGWRLLGQTLLLFLLTFIVGGLLLVIGNFFPALRFLEDPSLIAFFAITASVFLARRWLDQRSIRSLGLAWRSEALRDLVFGIALSGTLMGLIFLTEWGFGWLHFEGFAWQTSSSVEVLGGLTPPLLTFLFVGWYEELLSRGYHLQNLATGLNVPLAVLLSSGLFALGHLSNPHASWVSTLGILAAGYFLAYGYLWSKQLWLPIGLHIGWNTFEGPIFGFPVSGLETFSLIKHQQTGPLLLTGGAFGPEAGLIVFPALALGAGIMWWYTHKSNLRQHRLNTEGLKQ